MFTPDAIRAQIAQELAANPLPDGKRGALIVHGSTDGTVTAVLAAKIGDHWTISQDTELHAGDFKAGISVIASWCLIMCAVSLGFVA